jgi:hypothetical protein
MRYRRTQTSQNSDRLRVGLVDNIPEHSTHSRLKMTESTTCRLCRYPSELRESHIVPRSLIRLIRDEKLDDRFYALHQKVCKKIQDGPKEYLLCDNCEQKIGGFEKYFIECVHYGKHGTEKKHDDQCLVIKNVDYKRTKLFFLSLLWRMSASSRSEFEPVSIRGDDEERIRQMILREDAGVSSEYSVSAIIPLLNGRNREGWCSTPFVSDGEPPVYALVLGGILYYLCAGREKSPYPLDLCLNESGRWCIPFTDLNKIPFLREYIEHHFQT